MAKDVRTLVLAAVLLSGWLAGPAVSAAVPRGATSLDWIRSASTPTGSFVDEHGRTRIFHGINAVQKGFPWYYEPLLSDPRLIPFLNGMGFNVMRVGLMWSGAEPSQGAFNQTYYDVTNEIVADLADAGIYSLMDMHQVCVALAVLVAGMSVREGYPEALPLQP